MVSTLLVAVHKIPEKSHDTPKEPNAIFTNY